MIPSQSEMRIENVACASGGVSIAFAADAGKRIDEARVAARTQIVMSRESVALNQSTFKRIGI
jgi:hypothetical protein